VGGAAELTVALDFVLASLDDLAAIRALLAACGRRLAEQGFRNWLDYDPGARLEADLAEREVWLARDGDMLVGTFTVGIEPIHPYPPGFVSDGAVRPLYLNRVAVDPSVQGRGIGAACVREAEHRARSLRCDVVRLEALATNPDLRSFYERLGYAAVATRSRAPWTFTTFVKRVHD
jgi:GNAT superfamily N-acetyltransferase